jgi:2-succinyl-5-enolpyruvyl-6-hydroxy-3-cyclohexene-1-carboxylate synthase
MSAGQAFDATTAFARALVDEWARAGITDACVAPGSRSAPLALALTRDPGIRVHMHLDERSAAFFALGIAKASGRPAVVLTTSGTAPANLHPAVLEAHHARTPLIVCTADRPPELRDAGAGQTVDQAKLFGDAVRWFVDPGPPEERPDIEAFWRQIAARAAAEAFGPPAGPVHVNLPFREPLLPTDAPLVAAAGRDAGRPWTAVSPARRVPMPEIVQSLAAAVRAAPRGALVAGWGAGVTPETVARFATAAGWPVLADVISAVRSGTHAVSTYDALLRVESFAAAHRPDLALRIGAPLTSKAATRWLADDVPQWLADPEGAWLDPQRRAHQIVAADPEALLAATADLLGPPSDTSWLDGWLDAERRARTAIDDRLDGSDELSEAGVARDVVAAAPDGSTLVVASSMPVRDVESFAAPRDGLRVLANRGANGIDGFVSTALGVAAAGGDEAGGVDQRRRPVIALLGDVCLLHDANGLIGVGERDLDLTLVVVDNDGGGIFSFLPQADTDIVDHDEFETLFGTPHGVDLHALAALHGVPVTEVGTASAVAPAVREAVAAGGVRIVLARTDRAGNVVHHRGIWAAVADAVTA